MRRTDDENRDQEPSLAGLLPLVAGPPSGHAVIQFPRRTATAAASGSVGGVEPPSTPPSFQSLGSIIQSVVLRIKDDRIRLKVFRTLDDHDDDD